MAHITNANIPRVILGTMTFGLDRPIDPSSYSMVRIRGAENVAPFLTLFHSFGHIELDTALVYGDGDTEKVLAQLPTAHFKISTKVPPYVNDDRKQRGHTKENLGKQFRQSLKALEMDKVDILYLHAPDYETPFEETLKAIDELYKEGLFERNGYVVPTVYQGNYNPITRSVVSELLPCLKYYNIGFYAYNPICGGVLSGKYKFDDKVPEGSRYDPKTQATLRWMRHHSGLDSRDGIIMGASTVDQLNETLTALEKGPLPEDMLRAFDDAWERTKATSEWYFRNPRPAEKDENEE
ncbi:hypothetical protein FBU30_002114 [Linnemannia zychae]|nr:hypothetical protein FBU30_002114 [Linnemannia zychae]